MSYRIVLLLATVYPALMSLWFAVMMLLAGLPSPSTTYTVFSGLLPSLATAVFFASLYEEASGSISAKGRRKAVTVAAVLYAVGIVLTSLAIYTRRIPGYPAMFGSLAGYLGRGAWIVLLIIFAREAAPLGKRVASYVSVLLAALTAYGAVVASARLLRMLALGSPGRLGVSAVFFQAVIPALGILNSVVLIVFFVMVLRRRPALPVAE